jgi:hypothetical protein
MTVGDCPYISHLFAFIYLNLEQYKESLKHSQKALEINLTYLPANHQSLIATYK